MLTKLVLSLITINILMKTTSTQYYANQAYQNIPQQYYQYQQQEPQEVDYEYPMEHVYRRSSRYKTYGSSGGKLPYMNDYDDEGSEECKCSCKRCIDTVRAPKLCCRELCFNCLQMQGQPSQGGVSGVVFVPYPYPLMVPNLETKPTTSAPAVITTTAKPTKRAQLTVDESSERNTFIKAHRKYNAETVNDFLIRTPTFKTDKKYMLTTMRKTKPAWEPKYGIVPIPDTLAEKLMSQLRQVRELQARRF